MNGRDAFLSAASGLLLALAFPPLGWDWLAWIALVPLLWLVATRPSRSWVALGLGFLHGVVFYGVSLSWLYGFFRRYGQLSLAEAAGLLGLMVAVLALFPALFAAGISRLSASGRGAALAVGPALWVTLEWIRTRLPVLGFPWNLAGYAIANHLPLLQLTTLTGIYGLSFLVVGYNALLAAMLWKPSWHRLALTGGAALALLVWMVVGTRWIPQPAGTQTARLVQLNLTPQLSYTPSWFREHAGDLDQIVAQSAAGPADLIVWPEVPAPFVLGDTGFMGLARRVVHEAASPLLAGVDIEESGPARSLRVYNGAVLLSAEGAPVYTYAKMHLVPFGEYVPWRRYLFFARRLLAGIGDYTAGSRRTVAQLDGHRLGVFICYEAIFPDEVRQFVLQGAQVLVNLSDDGWYGTSAALAQHFEQARVRAVENRRWLLRDTNTGITAVVDPYGRVRQQIPVGQRLALDARFGFRSDRTLYTQLGDWWAGLCSIVSGMAVLATAIRRRPVPSVMLEGER
jgi:apolipoprotein N-acyltransferase